MHRFSTALCLPVLLAVGSVFAAERDVVIPDGTKPFKCSQTDFVRISASGIAGAKYDTKVTGPAKLEQTNNIQKRVGGGGNFGPSNMEFEFKGTGKGKVTIVVTMTAPGEKAKPVETKYEYTIE